VEVKFVRNVAPKKAGMRIRIHFIRIRIQHLRLNINPDPIRIQGFMTKNCKKITAEKKLTIYPSLGLHIVQVTEEAFSSQKRPYNTSKHELKKKLYFCGSFLPSWIRIRNPDPDSQP
jgi:hypothetical protein